MLFKILLHNLKLLERQFIFCWCTKKLHCRQFCVNGEKGKVFFVCRLLYLTVTDKSYYSHMMKLFRGSKLPQK